MIETKLKQYIYSPKTPLREVLADLYQRETSICLVCDEDKTLLGVITFSDLKQALLKGSDPLVPVSSLMNTRFIFAGDGTSLEELKKLAKKKTPLGTGIYEKIPVVDAKGRLKGLYILPESVERHNPTVLVTGGAGYVGSHVCRKLLAKGYTVRVLDKLLFGDDSIKELKKNKKFSLIQGDIGDIGTLVKAVQDVDAVIHLAGIVGDPASALNPVHTMETNHFSTQALINVCKHYQISRFVFSSSCSVYGASAGLLNEESELHPVSLYAQSKRYSERVLLQEAGEDFHPVILRFGTLYGLSPRMRFDLVANTMTAHAFTNKRIVVDGGAQWRPLLHVEDAASACVAALEAPLKKVNAQIFSVGDTDQNFMIEDIARAVQKHIPAAKIDILDTVKDRRDYRVSFSKINKVMGWKASRTLSEGIGEVVKALKAGKFKQWQDKKFNNYLTLRSVLEEEMTV